MNYGPHGEYIFIKYLYIHYLCYKSFKPYTMSRKEIKAFESALRKQRKEVVGSKTAAKKFLTDLGVFQLLVPKGTNQTVLEKQIS